jgi:hypothetical protein
MNMARGESTTNETREEIKRRARSGESLAAIARDLGVSRSTVQRYGTESKATGRAARAQAARKIDFAAMQVDILYKLAVGAARAAERIPEPYIVHGFGETGVMTHELAEPPAEAVRNFATAAGIGLDKIRDHLARQSDPRLAAAHSLLDSLAAGFTAAAASYEAPTDVE